MTTTQKSILFLALSLVLTWVVVFGAWAMGWQASPQTATLALALSMFGPAIAALICAFAFEKGRRVEALGLSFKPNWWWLLAWLIPLALAAGAVAFTLLLSGRTYVDIGTTIIAAAEQQDPAQGAQLRDIPHLGLITIAASAIIGGLINTPILTFSEELGWRGYLHHLWRPAGFWRASLATGVVWGIWHAPAILLFGLNYPENRELGVALFVVWCTLLSPIMTLVRDRGGSVWAAGILHGTANAVGGLTLAALSAPGFPWNGIVGIGGFLVLALGVVGVALARPTLAPRSSGA